MPRGLLISPSRSENDGCNHPMVCICQGSVAVTSAALRLKTRVAVLASINNDAARQPRVQHSRGSKSYDKNPSLAIDRLFTFHPPVTTPNYSSCLNNNRKGRPLQNPSDHAWVPW
jgi:hypothetical protein